MSYILLKETSGWKQLYVSRGLYVRNYGISEIWQIHIVETEINFNLFKWAEFWKEKLK